MLQVLRNLFAKPAPPERRLLPRYNYQFPIDVRTADGTLYQGMTRDFSQSGVGALVQAELAVGDPLVLTLHMTDGSKPRKMNCIVRRRVGPLYGIEFLEPL